VESFNLLAPGESFYFDCHSGIPCFNACCRDLTHYLAPYDIFRLTKGLGLTSEIFLKTYTSWHIGPQSGLPVVTLKALTRGLSCPFVSASGCTVYKDRPGACRTYPLGRMATRKTGGFLCEESYFLIREPHCLGYRESRQWTVEAWCKDQELSQYNAMNDLMMDILSAKRQSSQKRLSREETDCFMTACYNLEKFKLLYYEKKLWETDPQKKQADGAAGDDDESLLKFALAWVKKELFSMKA
jgi:uncharacterized protein